LSIGPTATAKRRLQRVTLAKRVRATDTLLQAWHAIRRNGETSASRKTREETREFGADLPRQLRRLNERLREGYIFSKQFGATPEKENGKGKRPLVIAPIPDRIVQRAILDVLQDATELQEVQDVLATPTSIGGIRGRGVEHAVALIEESYEAGEAAYVAGSDISGFFTKIRQDAVVAFIRGQTDDTEFVDLFAQALRVDLSNADAMPPEDRKLFPTDEIGVAQGCPLSALAGNIVLRDFDIATNDRGIRCVRYIDDFIILGRQRAAVQKAFARAKQRLNAMDMTIYDPQSHRDKAFFGSIDEHFDFLGYQIIPGLFPPAKKNQASLIASVRQELDEGRAHILRAVGGDVSAKRPQYFGQTITAVDQRVRAWSGSFRASRCTDTAARIDATCNQLIAGFIEFYRDRTADLCQTDRRRVLGVHVLIDDVTQRVLDRAAQAAASKPKSQK
jgi:RNA-directed DNA polymerase